MCQHGCGCGCEGGGDDACAGRKTDPRRGSVLLRPVRRGEEGADRHTRAYTYIPIFTLGAALGPKRGILGFGLRVRGPWQGGGGCTLGYLLKTCTSKYFADLS